MLEGLMQTDFQLNLQHVLERMRTINADAEIVTLRDADGTRSRASFGEVAGRVDRLAGALRAYGIEDGDRVATFMWNSQEHVELYLGAPCLGAVLHTLNIRLFPEQLVYVVNHAKDRIVFVDDSLVPLIEKVADQFETVEQYVLVGPGDPGSLRPVVRYEDFIADAEPLAQYPPIDERAAAALCYTSGTTGNPKGVLYSHRSSVLHSLAAGLNDTLGVKGEDRILPIVPQFHANAWGLIYAAGMLGASLVMTGRYLQAAPIVDLLQSERVTFAAAVPTIWMDVLRHLDQHPGADLSALKSVPCGGAAIPRALMEAFEERHGIQITQAWGMTETSPLGAVARPPVDATGEDRWSYKLSQGKAAPLVEIRIVAEDGTVQSADGVSTGEIQIRGPWIASGYYEDPEGSVDRFDDGWLKTGDIASIDAKGYVRISDRAKDVIKSGGEWISSVELENEIMAHPAVREAAVVAIPDERFTERPLGCIVVEDGATLEVEEIRAHLLPRVAKWWVPDAYSFIAEVPKTSVGKFDKKALRKAYADDELDVVHSAGEPAR